MCAELVRILKDLIEACAYVFKSFSAFASCMYTYVTVIIVFTLHVTAESSHMARGNHRTRGRLCDFAGIKGTVKILCMIVT